MLDLKTEAFLKRGGYKYDYVKVVQLKDIDLKTSMENPTRLVKQLNDDKVMEYGLKMENGIEFPALLLLTIDPGEKRPFKYDIATGCHRVAAAQLAGKKQFDAYIVVEADAYRRESLCRQANTIEGSAPTLRDNLSQICELHIKYKKPLAELARGWNVKIQTLNNFWNEEQAQRRARKYGFDPVRHKISRKALYALAGIHSEVVFEKAIRTVLDYGSANSEIEQLARDIKKVRDERSALNIINEYVTATTETRKRAEAKHGRAQPTKAVRLRGFMRNVVNVCDEGLDNLHLPSMPRLDMMDLLAEDVIEKMKALRAKIEAIQRIQRTGPEQPGVVH